MPRKNGFILVVLLLFSSPLLQANEETKTPKVSEPIYLATISTDYVKKTYDLLLDLNERKLISGIKTRNNKKNKIKSYPVSVLGKPITLVKAAGITLVGLSCKNFATSRGCDIEIEYPSNLTIGQFKVFHAKLEKRESQWVLTHQNKAFSKLHLKSRKFLGLLIGIKKVTASP